MNLRYIVLIWWFYYTTFTPDGLGQFWFVGPFSSKAECELERMTYAETTPCLGKGA